MFDTSISAEERLKRSAKLEKKEVLKTLHTSNRGLNKMSVSMMRGIYGDNTVSLGKKDSLFRRIWEAFINPFTSILIILAIVSFIMDVILAEPAEKDYMTAIIIIVMVLISGILRFIQETRSGNAAARLHELVKTTTAIERQPDGIRELVLEEVVVGDIIHLASGDIIPADVRILEAKDLFIGQSSLTGESEPVEKTPTIVEENQYDTITDYHNLAFMGTTVISGTATCVVVTTGDDTMYGSMAKDIVDTKVETSFEKGVNSVSWVLIRYMLVMVPIVLFINGFTKGDWLEALLFGISVAVGLTPEMLPMIVTASLSKGAVSMSKKKTIIKHLDSIQNLGAMDVLCTDKTGTLTQDKVALEFFLDVKGNRDPRVLRYGFLNSYFQTGLKNLIDYAIIDRKQAEQVQEKELQNISTNYKKVDEIPFDFERRRMSVVVTDKNERSQLITKGAVEEMFSICSYVEYEGEVMPLTEEMRTETLQISDRLNNDGLRVLAIARKENPPSVDELSAKDESEMILVGYVAFLDPPKETTEAAIRALNNHGVTVKILTGDNDKVARSVCKQVNLSVDRLLLGADVDQLNDEDLSIVVEQTTVFAKLTPQQKSRVVTALRNNGHTVGYMGDGINDAAAMKAADVGVSVDNAVDIAKESADVILLDKDLMVLEEGIIEGRKTYANMMKYIKLTASSNFGNMFSVLVASAFLPFLPMAAIHLLLLNLIYDITCIAMPWDNVDEEYLRKPRKWDASSISTFMLWFGPISSIFDITTYLLLYFIIAPSMIEGLLFTEITDPTTKIYYIAIFQTGWFVLSMWTQTFIIHMIRTPKIPFIQSRASFPVFVFTITGIIGLTIIPFTTFGARIGLVPLQADYFIWLVLTMVVYVASVQLVKKMYIRRYDELL